MFHRPNSFVKHINLFSFAFPPVVLANTSNKYGMPGTVCKMSKRIFHNFTKFSNMHTYKIYTYIGLISAIGRIIMYTLLKYILYTYSFID